MTASHRTKFEVGEVTGRRITSDDGRSNWLWLAELSQWDRALELRSDVGPQTPGLADHFRSVQCLCVDRAQLSREWQDLIASGYTNIAAACGTPVHLPFRNGAFDCVALDDVRTQALRREQVLRECCRILRKGGCLFTGATGLGVRRLTRDLVRTGFSGVQLFGAEPSWDEPRCIIPFNRAAVLGYERWVRSSSPLRDLVRRSLAMLGWHHLLYPSVILLAYR